MNDEFPKSRRIGRTKSPIIKLDKALDGRVLVIEKEDGSIYVLLSLNGTITKVKP